MTGPGQGWAGIGLARRLAASRRQLALAAAVASFAVVFVLRLLVSDPAVSVSVLYVIPIAIVAVELGLLGGAAAALAAFALFGFWDIAIADSHPSSLGSFVDYLGRGLVFVLVGAGIGLLAERLRRSATENARFWELANELLAIAGFDGRFRRLNPAWEQALGWSLDELRSRPFVDFVHPDDRQRTVAETAQLSDAGVTVNFENRYRCKDGSYRTLLWSARGEPADGLIYAFARDISERVETGRRLREARDEAERANRAKSAFLSRMSHELRTPLNAIIGFGQLLELEETDPRRRENVAQILRGGRHLLELINEVLDISRIESGTMSISLEPVRAGSVLAEVLSMVRPLAQEAGVHLDADPADLDALYALADQQRLRQVLINLLSNAVKYNREGGSVVVSCEPAAGRRLRFVVADTGRGMDPAQLAALFTPFERLGAERTEIEGTGLGLALSKGLVEAMGGTIEAESEPGAGTTISFELAAAERPSRSPAAERGPAPLAGEDGVESDSSRRHKVLYIEDNPSNLELVEQALGRLEGVRLIPAMHGRLGLELAREHRPLLILLDLHLPDIGGDEVLDALKGDPTTAEIPVAVVSADATAGQVDRLREAGAAAYLTKPIDVRELLDLVDGEITARTAGRGSDPV